MESLNQTSKKIFCKIIEAMKGEQRLKIKNGIYLPLTVELLDENISTVFGKARTYSFCHYYEQNGDLMQDPEMCFIFVDNRTDKSIDWEQVVILPYMYQHTAIAFEQSIFFEHKKVVHVKTELLKKHVSLADQWMSQIHALGFLKFI